MDTRGWQQVQRLVEAALELEPDRRQEYIDGEGLSETCRRRAYSLLLACDDLGTFLERRSVDDSSSVPSETTRDWTGRDLGSYRVLEEIGRGGMAQVYRARRNDGTFDQEVAIKRVRPSPGVGLEERFLVEREILGSLSHPSIARLLDAGSSPEGTPYAVMELVVGEPITTFCDRRRLAVSARLDIFSSVCDAVAHAHRHLIVHRDLKPSNVLVSDSGRPMLLDFGIASALASDAPSGNVVEPRQRGWALTPRYASPEQFAGERPSTSMDIYSLGVLLYELLVGSLPYGSRAGSIQQWLVSPTPPSEYARNRDVADRRSTSAARLEAELRGDLDAIVLRALAFDPTERYPSVTALADDIRNSRDLRPVAARGGGRPYRLRCFIRRRRFVLFASTAALVALLSTLLAGWNQAQIAAKERDRAQAVQAHLIEIFRLADPARAGGKDVTVREVLDRAASEIGTAHQIPGDLEGEILAAMGQAYHGLGLYDRAAELSLRALELQREQYGEHSSRLLETLIQISSSLREQGDTERAVALAREANNLVGDSELAVTAALNLAEALLQAGELDEAEKLARLAHRNLAKARSDRADALDTLVEVLWTRGEMEAAIPIAIDAIEQRRDDPEDPKLATSLNNLAAIHLMRQQAERAEQLQQEALTIQQRFHGLDHPEVTTTLNNLAYTYTLQGKHHQAREIYHQALDRLQHERTGAHPFAVSLLGNLGDVALELGECVRARDRYQEAITAGTEVWPNGHLQLGQLESSLGLAFHCTHQEHEAIEAYDRALHHATEHGESRRRLTISGSATAHRAISLSQLGLVQEAEEDFTKALELLIEAVGEVSLSVASNRNNFADFLLEQGRLEEASTQTQLAYEAFTSILPEGHWRLIHAENVRAAVEHRRTGSADSLVRLETTYRQLVDAVGPGSHGTKLAKQRWHRAQGSPS